MTKTSVNALPSLLFGDLFEKDQCYLYNRMKAEYLSLATALPLRVEAN